MDAANYVQHGAMGVLALAAVTAVGVLWRSLQEERKQRDVDAKAHAAEREKDARDHAAELKELRGETNALLERIIDNNATVARQQHDVASRSATALEALNSTLTTLPRRTTRRP